MAKKKEIDRIEKELKKLKVSKDKFNAKTKRYFHSLKEQGIKRRVMLINEDTFSLMKKQRGEKTWDQFFTEMFNG